MERASTQPYEGNAFTPWNTMLQVSYNITGYRMLFVDGVATAILFHGVNQELFHTLISVQINTKMWQRWYNEERPHSAPVLWSAFDCCYSTGTWVPNTGRIQEGNTNPFAGAWMSFDLPKQEKEDEDQQERVDSLLTGGTNLGGRLHSVKNLQETAGYTYNEAVPFEERIGH